MFKSIRILAVIIFLPTSLNLMAAKHINNNSPTITVQRSKISIPVELSGRISPLDTIDLSAATNAQITEVYVKLGQKVTKDQPLLKLKSDQLEIDIRNAKETLIRSELDYNNKKSWSQSDEVFQAEQAKVKHKLSMQTALDLYNQNQKLYKQGIIARSELEQSKINYNEAKLNHELSTRHLKQIIAQGNDTQISLMQLNYENAKAKMELLEQVKEKLLVKAPIDGVILKPHNNSTDKSNKTNNFLAVGYTATTGENLLAIGNLQGFTVAIAANEQIIQHLTLDEKVNITIPALNNNVIYSGTIAAIDAQPNNADNLSSPPLYNVKVTSSATDPKNNIYLGMTAKINFELVEKPNSLLIPFNMISYKNNQPYVLKQDASKRFQIRFLELGQTTADKIEVLSGLKDGDTIKASV